MPPPTSAAGTPAILVKIPGTGGAATLDGYSMAKQGRGQQALVLTFVASTLGGLVTSIATLFALPYLVRVGYDVHSVEMVVIMLLALTLITVIAARDTLKGLIAGFFGLLLGAMGSDWIYATPEALPLSGQPGATTSMSMPGD
jgi:putative tricarboxylic transport membrane protein